MLVKGCVYATAVRSVLLHGTDTKNVIFIVLVLIGRSLVDQATEIPK